MIIYLPNIPKRFKNTKRRLWEWNAKYSIENRIARELCEKLMKLPREERENGYNFFMDRYKDDKKMMYCFAKHKEHIIPEPRVWGK